jgi:hypothetical protein
MHSIAHRDHDFLAVEEFRFALGCGRGGLRHNGNTNQQQRRADTLNGSSPQGKQLHR